MYSKNVARIFQNVFFLAANMFCFCGYVWN